MLNSNGILHLTLGTLHVQSEFYNECTSHWPTHIMRYTVWSNTTDRIPVLPTHSIFAKSHRWYCHVTASVMCYVRTVTN